MRKRNAIAIIAIIGISAAILTGVFGYPKETGRIIETKILVLITRVNICEANVCQQTEYNLANAHGELGKAMLLADAKFLQFSQQCNSDEKCI